MTKEYPKIGQSVAYARADEKGQVHQGKGKVSAIFVGVDKRLMVQVRDGENAWNVDLAMIDPSPDQVDRYSAAIVEVQRLTDEGNAKVKATVDAFNADVEAVYKSVLGDFVDMDAPETVTDEPTVQ